MNYQLFIDLADLLLKPDENAVPRDIDRTNAYAQFTGNLNWRVSVDRRAPERFPC